jgi:hypothetical protein
VSSEDEFVEFYNDSGIELDISNYELYDDSFNVRHVFPSGTTVSASCSIIVFGGGTPTGTFGNAVVQTASSGTLGLGNSGDTILLFDSFGTLVTGYAYGTEGGNDTSLTRSPDITGADPLVQHLTVSPLRFSPGTMIDGAAFSGCAGTPAPVISGQITFENAAAPVVPVPSVDLNAPGSPAVMAISDSNGEYSLSGFGAGPYTVTPSKATQPFTTPNGIFSNDASLISRHVVGLITLTAAQQNAARVAGQPTITSQDAGLLAQYIVGIPNAINQSGQWKFTPINRSYPSVTTTQTNQDFAATLMGDVSGDWNPLGPRPFEVTTRSLPLNAIVASVPDVNGYFGKIVSIPIRLDNTGGEAISSYQFTLEFDPEIMEPAKIAADLTGTMAEGMSLDYHSPRRGVINVVVYGAFPITGDGIYVALSFTAAGKPGTSSPLEIKGLRLNDGKAGITAIAGRMTISGP